MKLRFFFAASLVALAPAVWAADHLDFPNSDDPTTDITDLYAWMTDDAQSLNLIMNVHAGAGDDAAFSDAVAYVFHVNSTQGLGELRSETRIICKFADETNIECWLGDEYVAGDPSDPSGIVSDSGNLRVFAGLRDDPFFMEFEGFTATVDAAVGAVVAGEVDFDDEGCAELNADQQAALVGLLTTGPNGTPANTFAGQNVLSLVVQVNKSLVVSLGPVLGVWASTHEVSP